MPTKNKQFVAVYKGKQTLIEATNSLEAQFKALDVIKPSKKYMLAIFPFDPVKHKELK